MTICYCVATQLQTRWIIGLPWRVGFQKKSPENWTRFKFHSSAKQQEHYYRLHFQTQQKLPDDILHAILSFAITGLDTIGTLVDFFDVIQKWTIAEIKSVSIDKCIIHQLGWQSRFDRFVVTDEFMRIQVREPFSHSQFQFHPTQDPSVNEWFNLNTDIQDLQTVGYSSTQLDQFALRCGQMRYTEQAAKFLNALVYAKLIEVPSTWSAEARQVFNEIMSIHDDEVELNPGEPKQPITPGISDRRKASDDADTETPPSKKRRAN